MNKTRFILTILIITTLSSQCINGLRILGLFPLQGKSHFVMCERLVRGLAAKGHQIDVYSHFPLKNKIANYTDYSLVGTARPFTNNIKYEHVANWKSWKLEQIIGPTSSTICQLMDTPVFQELFDRLKKNQPYDAILIEVSVGNCFLAWGRYLNIPMIGIMTSALKDWYGEPLGNPHNTAVYPLLWSQFSHPMNFWERLTNTYMYYDYLRGFNSVMNQQNEYIKKIFGPGYPDASELTKDLDLFLVNTHHSIDGIKAYTPAIIPVGGLHVYDDGTKLPEDVQKWLDDSKDGCIYFSFGSMARIETLPKEIVSVFYETFKRIAPVRVLLKIAKPEELPSGLPSNVMTRSWFSQYQVLKHKNIKIFITHGGLMGIQESLSAGVPMIGIPIFSDQYVNTKFQASRNVAKHVDLESIDENKFTSAIKEVLTNPIYKNNAVKYSKDFYDRPMSPLDTAIFWIEYIVRNGKQALKSPIVDMPWWQANLFDIYGFIILVIIVALYTFKLLTKTIINYLRSLSFDKKKRE